MLKIKDNVNIEDLKKYGFKIMYDEKTGKPNELIKDSSTPLMRNEKFVIKKILCKITHKRKKGFVLIPQHNYTKYIWCCDIDYQYINTPHYMVSCKWLDTLYELIKDDVIEKIY